MLGRGEPHRATGGLVTPNFFQMLGARPHLGRMLLPTDEGKTAQPVAVLTVRLLAARVRHPTRPSSDRCWI